MGTSLEAPPFAVETSDVGANDQLKNIIMTTRDLPAMPQVASKVLELSSDPNTSAQQLQQIIADDQAMTARILKIANSAMYSCSRKVKTLTEAIVMLGFNSIRSLVVTSAARNLYNTRNSTTGLKERLLWEHSIGVAFACRLLVQDRMPALAEEAFLAGLMHDIGKLVLNLQVPDACRSRGPSCEQVEPVAYAGRHHSEPPQPRSHDRGKSLVALPGSRKQGLSQTGHRFRG
jgi:HD-like signal output (HDOD) protein